jgi:hypothetical protein
MQRKPDGPVNLFSPKGSVMGSFGTNWTATPTYRSVEQPFELYVPPHDLF